MSKGSAPRPISDPDWFGQEWERIFGKAEPPKDEDAKDG